MDTMQVLPVHHTTESITITPAANRANWVHFLFSGVILLGSMAYYQTTQAEALRREVSQLKRDNVGLRTSLSKSDHALQNALTAFHRELDQFHAELVSSHVETGESVAIAQANAVHHTDALVGKLEKKHRQQEEQQRQLSAELSKVKESTVETSTRLNDVSSDVGTVRSEVESVRSVARQASSTVQQTRGDVGMIGGIIATSAQEIQTLRDMGDRDVYEFTLTKADGMQRVGDIQMLLGKTDTKKNQFTVEILAADQRVEKRDKSVNEPVQFYVPGRSSQPYELVINTVNKNSVQGYLTSPKITVARNESVN
jgi:chromosome segregation ATPase